MFIINSLYNCNDYFFYYLTKLIGKSNIYYRRLYTYMNTNTSYTINKIILDRNDQTLSYFFNSIPSYYDHLLEINYTVNNKNYWIQYDSFNKIENFKFPIYTDLSGEAFGDTDDSIILITLSDYQGTLNEDRLLSIIKELSGPKGNFYKDLGYRLSKKNIINLLNREMGTQLNENHTIELMYSNGEILII